MSTSTKRFKALEFILQKNFYLIVFSVIISFSANAQNYTRRNSPYSRYGLGDVFSSQFTQQLSTGGAFSATYNSVWDASIINPAALGHLQTTAFEAGVFYKHSQLSEYATGQKAAANDGNLSYLSLSFPITRSWEIETDTLRKGIPIQWGMGLSLSPHSTIGYDARITRNLTDIGEVEYRYAGDGTRFRANWANGIRYKGLSVGANLALLFGTVSERNIISFQDSSYNFAYNERVLNNENTLGLLWDFGAQYDLYLTKKKDRPNPFEDLRLTLGAYTGSSSKLRILDRQEKIRYGSFYGIDTLLMSEDIRSSMQLPLSLGTGIAITKGMNWRFGVNYEAQFWNNFSYPGINMANSYTVSAGAEFTPNFKDVSNYFNRIRYRLGSYYGKDARIIGAGTETYQLLKYGITFGLGLMMKPQKSTNEYAIMGQTQLGFEFGYLGHPELINEYFFQVNLAFSLNDGSWFRRAKFR